MDISVASSSVSDLLNASRGKTRESVATRASCSGLCVIQIQVRPFNVLSTNNVDSGSRAEVGSIAYESVVVLNK